MPERFVISLLAVLVATGIVHAASTDFELFEPTPGPELGLTTESARVGHPGWTVGAMLQYEHRPVRFDRAPVGTISGVRNRTQARLLLARQLWERLLISLDAPIVLHEEQALFDTQTAGFNDLRLKSRVLLYGDERFAIALSLGSLLPTGGADHFGGTIYRALQPWAALLTEVNVNHLSFRLNAGYQELDDTDLPTFGLELRDRLDFRLGFSWEITTDTGLFVDYVHRVQLQGSPALGSIGELFLGGQVAIGDWRLKPAVAMAMASGFGQPDFRLIAGVSRVLSRTSKPVVPTPAPVPQAQPKPEQKPESPLVSETVKPPDPEIPCGGDDNNCKLQWWFENRR